MGTTYISSTSWDPSKLSMYAPIALLVSYLLGAAAAPERVKRAQPQGIDVSSAQGNVVWASVAAAGVQFAYVKATQDTSTRQLWLPLILVLT